MKKNNRNKKKSASIQVNDTNNSWLKSLWLAIKRLQKGVKITILFSLIGLIFSAITTYYVIKDHQPPKSTYSEELLKDSVFSNISVIEKTFNLEKCSSYSGIEKDSVLYLIKHFKQLSCELSVYVKELYETPSISSLSNKQLEELLTYLESINRKHDSFKDIQLQLIGIVDELDKYGKENNISGYIINQPLYDKVQEAKRIEEEYSDPLLEGAKEVYRQNTDLLTGYASVEKKKHVLLDIISYMDEDWCNIYMKRYLNEFLQFLIIQNNNYDLSLQKRAIK